MWTMLQHSAAQCPFGATAKGVAAAVLVMSMAGCAQAPAARQSAAVSAAAYQATFDAAIDALREAGFTIDRQDYRFGTITTKPRPSPAAFELWNGDNSTGEQALGATIGAERRVATVRLTPVGEEADAPGIIEGRPSAGPTLEGRAVRAAAGAAADVGYVLTFEVVIERMQDADRRITGATLGPRITRRLKAMPSELIDRQIPGRYWVAVARDKEMEGRLLERVTGAR
jgi:hypothetical protein